MVYSCAIYVYIKKSQENQLFFKINITDCCITYDKRNRVFQTLKVLAFKA